MWNNKKGMRKRNRGVALMDALLATIMVFLGAMAYFSLVPVVQRGQFIAQQQTTAMQISNRLIEHLLLLKPTNLNVTSLTQLNLIDPGQNAPPYKFTNLPLDDGWMYSPARVLPGAVGTMNITDAGDGAKLITITINWNGPKVKMSHTTGTIVGAYR